MRKVLLALTCCCFTGVLFSQSWSWAAGSTSTSYATAEDIETDSAGYSYIFGTFQDSAWFGSILLTEPGGPSSFIAKYSPGGACIWAHSYPSLDYGVAIGIDDDRNCFVLGHTVGQQYGLAKWDSAGNFMWATPLPAGVIAENVFIESGWCWIMGRLSSGQATFGASTLTGPVGLLALYDPAGVALLARQVGTTGKIHPEHMTQDANGDLFVAASLWGADTLGVIYPVDCDGSAVLVFKLDNAGNTLWYQLSVAVPLSTSADAAPTGIALDPTGDCYVTAVFAITDFVFGNDTVHMGTHYDTPAVLKFSNSGTVMWIVQPTYSGSNTIDFLFPVCTVNALHFTGWCDQDFTLGSLSVTNTSTADRLGFVIGLDFNGNALYEQRTSGNGSAIFPRGISADQSGGIYVAGYYEQGISFGPYSLPVSAGSDAFVAKVQTNISGIGETISGPSIVLLTGAQPQTFTLQLSDALLYEDAHFVLYDMSGRVVKSVAITGAQTVIDCGDLAGGVYTWSVENTTERFSSGKLVN